jgi:hypothetical protein
MEQKCYLTEINNNNTIEYTTPIYTSLNGVYGYLTVEMFNVYFFWYYDDSIHYDIITDRFKVEYKLINQ